MFYDITIKYYTGYRNFQVDAESLKEAERIANEMEGYPSIRNAEYISVETADNQNKLF